MATYKQIIEYVKAKHGYSPKNCWIADVKKQMEFNMSRAHNRKDENTRVCPCPKNRVEDIKKAIISTTGETTMRNKFYKIAFAATFGFALALTLSCDTANPPALVGIWLYESGSKDSKKPERSIELFKDGTGECDGKTISWKIKNKRLILLSSLQEFASNYEVSGHKLTLTYDDGMSAIFVNKEYVEAEKAKAKVIAETVIKIRRDKVKRGSFTDTRDNKIYKTVKLDNQTWMAENLNYEAEGKCYDNSESNCQKYGRLYDWKTALKACPSGWHLPNNAEWDALYHFADGTNGMENPYKSETAGKYLKSASDWNGEDAYGFAALPGGDGSSDGDFNLVGNVGYWWSASDNNASIACYRSIYYNFESAIWGNSLKRHLFSVRCVQD
jgi:uncharacterized protein (TIGR02145 family)